MAATTRKSPSRTFAEHRVLVVARDRQLGIVVADNISSEGIEVRGPIPIDECASMMRDYVGQAMPLCIALVEHEPHVCVPIVEDARGLPGVEVVVIGRMERAEDVAELLNLGACDVMRPDTAAVELSARLQRCLAVASAGAGTTLAAAHLTLDLARREVRNGETVINVTRTEFEVLTCLARQANRAIPAGEILAQVFGYPRDADSHVLTVHIQRLRAKVEPNPRQPTLITSVRGVGYMLIAD